MYGHPDGIIQSVNKATYFDTLLDDKLTFSDYIKVLENKVATVHLWEFFVNQNIFYLKILFLNFIML